ncbi:DUF3083 family protein [Pasteurella multocida]|uniref:DUF3083 family protein n=1 Tax=Pasteurella multocida TaxID=747 RepID=UPI001F535DE3|nr:DUF3083 family protein [Pasteurella multocida]
MEIHEKSLLGAFLKNRKVKLASGKIGEVTDFDPLERNSEFEITTGSGSFWVNKNGVPCDYKRHDNPSNVVEILEE